MLATTRYGTCMHLPHYLSHCMVSCYLHIIFVNCSLTALCLFKSFFIAFLRYSHPILSPTAPSAPPTSFHVVILNSTAIELQWGLPVDTFRNGIIRGYKLFIKQQGTIDDTVITVLDNSTTEYIITGLTANTAYVCSMLAFTVADGPRTIHLTAITMEDGKVLNY